MSKEDILKKAEAVLDIEAILGVDIEDLYNVLFLLGDCYYVYSSTEIKHCIAHLTYKDVSQTPIIYCKFDDGSDMTMQMDDAVYVLHTNEKSALRAQELLKV